MNDDGGRGLVGIARETAAAATVNRPIDDVRTNGKRGCRVGRRPVRSANRAAQPPS